MRYRRTERNLFTVGINVERNYYNEHRGFRLLRRSMLVERDEKAVLTTSGTSYEMDKVIQAMQCSTCFLVCRGHRCSEELEKAKARTLRKSITHDKIGKTTIKTI